MALSGVPSALIMLVAEDRAAPREGSSSSRHQPFTLATSEAAGQGPDAVHTPCGLPSLETRSLHSKRRGEKTGGPALPFLETGPPVQRQRHSKTSP